MKSYRSARNIQKAILYAVIIVLGFLFLFPFFWMIISSFKLNKDVLALPIRFFPPEWNWFSYIRVFTAYPDFDFPRYILNSTIVTIAAVFLCLFFSATAGYGFAKYRFKGNNLLFMVVLATIMITFEAIVVPLFILVRKMGMQNSYPGLIIPMSLTAFGVFMRRQFFFDVPNDFIESARNSRVKLVACSMTMDIMGIKKEELIDGVEIGGVAMYLAEAESGNFNLFI